VSRLTRIDVPFDFRCPWFLVLLPVPVVFWVWRVRHARAALRYPGSILLTSIPQSHLPQLVGNSLRFLALTCAVLALAGPRLPDLKTRLPTEGIAIVFLLDNSGSMQDDTFEWTPGSAKISRAEAVRRAFRLFVAGGEGPDGVKFEGRSTERGTDAIGLVTFSNWPNPVCPPTLNHSVLLNILDHLEPPSARDTGTNIGDAIAEGVNRLDHTQARRKVLILLSDGEHNVDLQDPERQPLKPRQAASLAANLGIPVYTIDAGGDAPTNDTDASQRREAGRKINQAVAEMTGGKFFNANDGSQLLDVCRQIDAMERQPIVSPVYRRYHEFYPYLALAAAAGLVLVFGLEQTAWRRIP
jgi:Ca-activated chloride channel family protein